MLEGFVCLDGTKVKLEACYRECRLGDRCQEEPDLHMVGAEREWKGLASTTQLLNGTMYSFLKLTKPYWVDPDKQAFMLQGTKHHKALEEVAKELGIAAEIPLSVDRDIFDLLVFQGKTLCLVDRKMWGSFKIAKALGIVEVGKKPDPSGECYKTSGRWGKAGSPKMVPVWDIDPGQADNWEAELQLNRYRVMLGELGLHVGAMYLRVLARDGGLYIAQNRGVFRNTYKISVRMLPDQEVKDYFFYKAECLRQTLAGAGWDSPCTDKESWDGKKCESFCDVWEYCSKGVLVHSLGQGADK